MGDKTVTLLLMALGVLFLLTVVTSKPISLNTAADESDSDEANSSESENEETEEVDEVEEPELREAAVTEALITEALITEPAIVVTEAPSVVSLNETPATIALPVASVDATVLPAETIDPQTSTDGLQLLPEDPSQTSEGVVEVSHAMPETDPAHDPLAQNMDVGAEVGVAADLPQHQTNDVQREVFPTLYPPYGKGKSTHVSVINAVPVHVSNPGVPVCFTFHSHHQYVAPQYNPPRGDSY